MSRLLMKAGLAMAVFGVLALVSPATATAQYPPACYNPPGVNGLPPVTAWAAPPLPEAPYVGARYSFYGPGYYSAAYYSTDYQATRFNQTRYPNPGPYYYTPTYSYTPGYYSYYYTPGFFRY